MSRLFSFALVCLAASSAWAVHLDVPSFKQCDSRWGSDPLGTCSYTMCQAGCAVTSTAMVYQYYGGTMTPGELNECLTNNGGYLNGCLIYWENDCMPPGVTVSVSETADIDAALAAGHPVIVKVTNADTSQHFVVIVGNDGGEYEINDPYWDYATIAEGGYTIHTRIVYSGQHVEECQVTVAPTGETVIDDLDGCFVRHGAYWWEDPTGYEGHHYYTYAIDDSQHDCWAQWNFHVEQAGTYDVEVYVPESEADSRQARYTVLHAGVQDEIRLDQTAGTGWRYLGQFDFDEGDGQYVALHDNTGEPLSDHIPVGFDAVRLTPVTEIPPDAGVPDAAAEWDAGDAEPEPHDGAEEDATGVRDGGRDTPQGVEGGCQCGTATPDGATWALLVLGLFLIRAKKREERVRR